MTVCAIVVSYNRKNLLARCLTALKEQTLPLDEVIVVDNGSTDGAPALVEEEFPEFSLVRTGKNLGGAGGFAWGLELAIARGHDFAWVMDDDGRPEPDALEWLLKVDSEESGVHPFLASLVTLDADDINPGNVPVVSNDPVRHVEANRLNAVAIDSATFVGVLINLTSAAATHLPIIDYFIWADDTEYTRRLSRSSTGLLVPASKISHPLNKGDAKDIGGRLFYFIRNNLWLLREGEYTTMYRFVRIVDLILHSTKQGIHAKDKKTWLSSVTKGYWQGLAHKPMHNAPGELLRELPPSVRDTASTRGASVILDLK